MNSRRRQNFRLFVLLSLGLHLVLSLIVFDYKLDSKGKSEHQKSKKSVVKMTYISKDKLARLREHKSKKLKVRRQIVNTEATGKKIRPKNSRFLGERDQTFEKQTVAKSVGSFKKAGRGKESGSKAKHIKAKGDAKIKEKKLAKSGKDRKKTIKKKGLNLSNLGITSKLAANKVKNQADLDKMSAKKLGTINGQGKGPGLGINNDYVKDVPLGNMTNLNTVEFKYFGFYDRIRKQLEQYWGHSLRQKAMKLYHQGRQLTANEEYITAVKIVLDVKGNIVKVMITSSSGLNDLDDAAVESFNKAGPFPNPPRGMLMNGQAIIEWGFVVKS